MTPNESIHAKIEESRRELLDLSNRNRLLNYRPLHAQGVEIIGEDVSQVFRTLVTEGRAMSFRPGRNEVAGRADMDVSLLFAELAVPVNANQSDRALQTGETPSSLDNRLLRTFRLANSTIQETGVNTLFLALGMLHWYEADSSDVERLAPLVLVPVKLERAGVRQRFRLLYTGEDLGVNLSFIERTREFGVFLPGAEVLDPDNQRDVDPIGYIKRVEEVVSQSAPQNWYVEPDRIALSFFSFNKLLMYLDLASPAIVENDIINALFGDGFREPPSDIPDGIHLDAYITPSNTFHVLDADSSQALAIRDAIGQRNLVVQGPPGTGKSQTIANIIAESIARGKRTLFVSEKMAALDVVKRRLDLIGLGDACLELHSNKTNKRATLDELNRVLNLGQQSTIFSPVDDFGRTSDLSQGSRLDSAPNWDELTRNRDRLNAYAEAVNAPVGRSGVTPQDAFGQLLALGNEPSPNPVSWKQLPDIGQWSQDDFRRKREVVEDLRRRLENCGVPAQHPFWGSRLRVLLPSAQGELRDKLAETMQALETLESNGALPGISKLETPVSVNEALTLQNGLEQAAAAPDLSGLDLSAPQWNRNSGLIEDLLEQAARWQEIRRENDAVLVPEAWNASLGGVRQTLSTDGRKFFGRLFSSDYKRAKRELASLLSGPLPKSIDEQIALIDTVQREQQLRAAIDDGYGDAALALGACWQGHRSNWGTLAVKARWWLVTLNQAANGLYSTLAVRLLQAAGARVDGENWKAGFLRGAADALEKAIEEYRTALTGLQSALDLDCPTRFGDQQGLSALPFADQRHVLSLWADRLSEIQDLIGFNNSSEAVSAEGLGTVARIASQHPDAAHCLSDWFERAWYESIVETAFSQRPALVYFEGRSHENYIEHFRDLDQASLIQNRTRVSQRHLEGLERVRRLPSGLVRAPSEDSPEYEEQMDTRRKQLQLRFLRREIEKKSRHRPIRKLLEESGGIVQELKPVFMMSPLSIANYLAPGAVEFDLVVFDEASQVRPVDALGALGRASRAVVVGDSRQLPPTNFFDRVTQDDEPGEDSEEGVTADIENVLGLFASQGSPSRELRWHYRSRHESLIAVSNREFYNNNLVVFPSPDASWEEAGLRYRHLPDSVYDRGRSRTNPWEADAVARAVMEHTVSHPNLSLGVAAFSQAQAQAIEDRLETLRRQDNSAEDFFANHPEEPFFVKNLENVQGDERDVIYISVGYGHDENGRVYQNFGPINQSGGERRLNVLITRAKLQCHVFTNLHADDINASGSPGVRALRTFLAYAETGTMPDNPLISSFEVDSPFQREVAARLDERGYIVEQEIASGGYFIDIGIRDNQRPGRYIIGIECDGATYHSARSARDRDRLREQHLQSLGWKLHRIWSTDWFRNPARELERAVSAIELAITVNSFPQKGSSR